MECGQDAGLMVIKKLPTSVEISSAFGLKGKAWDLTRFRIVSRDPRSP